MASQVHATILEGLAASERGNLLDASRLWERALRQDPASAAARACVDAIEGYFRALATGADTVRPDFRRTLELTRFPFSAPASDQLGPPDIGEFSSPDLDLAERGSPRNRPTTMGLPAGNRRTSTAPRPTAMGLPGAPIHERQTASGRPLRTTGVAPAKQSLFSDEELEGFEAGSPPDQREESTPPGLPTTGSSPRYRGVEPPRYQRSKGSGPRFPGTPSSNSHPTAGASDSSGLGLSPIPQTIEQPRRVVIQSSDRDELSDIDPWADLSSELAEVPETNWNVPRSGRFLGDSDPPQDLKFDWQSDDDVLDLELGDALGSDGGADEIGASVNLPDGSIYPFAVLRQPTLLARFAKKGIPAHSRNTTRDNSALGRDAGRRAISRQLDIPNHSPISDGDDKFFEDGDFLPPPIDSSMQQFPAVEDSGRSRESDFLPARDSAPIVHTAPHAPVVHGPWGGREDDADEFVPVSLPSDRPPSSQVPGTSKDKTAESERRRRSERPSVESKDDTFSTLDRRDLWERAKRYQALGDFTTSLRVTERLVEQDPADDVARALMNENRAQIEAQQVSKLGSLDAIPRVALGQEQLVWHDLDAKKGFLLSRIDGTLTVQDIIDIVHFPHHETVQLLAELVEAGIMVSD